MCMAVIAVGWGWKQLCLYTLPRKVQSQEKAHPDNVRSTLNSFIRFETPLPNEMKRVFRNETRFSK